MTLKPNPRNSQHVKRLCSQKHFFDANVLWSYVNQLWNSSHCLWHCYVKNAIWVILKILVENIFLILSSWWKQAVGWVTAAGQGQSQWREWAGALRTGKEKLTYRYCLNQHPGNWLDLTLHFSWLKFILNRVLNVGNMWTPSSLLVCESWVGLDGSGWVYGRPFQNWHESKTRILLSEFITSISSPDVSLAPEACFQWPGRHFWRSHKHCQNPYQTTPKISSTHPVISLFHILFTGSSIDCHPL